MPLPNLEQSVPQFEIIIPSLKTAATFRPFLVKEEKLLLIAVEENDERKMLDAIIQVVRACALTPLKVEDLASFDLEYIFLQLRSRSVDANVQLRYRCRNEITLTPEEAMERFLKLQPTLPFSKRSKNPELETPPTTIKCDNVVMLPVNLNDIEVKFTEGHTREIMLTETLGVRMKYPNLNIAKKMIRTKTEDTPHTIHDALATVALSVEAVFDGENTYTNFSEKEIQQWVENLTQQQFSKIQEFFETTPKLAHEIPFKCDSCGYEETLHLEGLATFFA